MKELPVNVVMCQLENNHHIYRLDNRKIRVLFVNIFSKVKRVPKVKRIIIPDNLVLDIATKRITCLKGKNKNRETLSYINWINFKNHFVYNQNLNDEHILKSQIESLLKCKKTSTRNNLFIYLKKF